jgi:hypothetical protein
MDIHQILLIVALACFVLAALNVNAPIGLVPAGLAVWVLSLLV